MRLTIVHPCYNEEETIAHTVRSTLAWITDQHVDAQVIVVNDGSSDASASILDTLQEDDSRLSVVHLSNNGGYGIAVRAGCDEAKGDYIAFMDSDGQFQITDLSRLLQHLDQHRVVVGRRRKRADSFVRNLFGKVLGAMVFVTFGLWIRDVNCGLKVFDRSLWPKMRPEYGTEKFFNTELFLRLKREGVEWKQVDVPHYSRAGGSPTGASFHVILGMFRELISLKKHLR